MTLATKGSRLGVAVHDLTRTEVDAVDALLGELTGIYSSAEDPDFLSTARGLAFRHLPDTLTGPLTRFRETEYAHVFVVAGLPIDAEAIGPTPEHWNAQPDRRSTLREELYQLLLGSVLGDPFGWATLQKGRLVQNVLPIRDQENEQSGHGSLTTLAWHTEDGFHPYRCDYLSLLALRNEGRVPTMVGSIADVELTPDHLRVLAEPRFLISADNEHIGQRAREGEGAYRPPADWREPTPAAVLFGDLTRPYLRIDPYFMTAVPGDAEAAEALRALIDGLGEALTDIPLDQGMLAFIDNFRAVHGREAFKPRYDGGDRWLKKVIFTRDLRRSRSARQRPDSRVLQPVPLSHPGGVTSDGGVGHE